MISVKRPELSSYRPNKNKKRKPTDQQSRSKQLL